MKKKSDFRVMLEEVHDFMYSPEKAPERIRGWNMLYCATFLGTILAKNGYVKGALAGLNFASRYNMCKDEAVAFRAILDKLDNKRW